MLLTYLKVFAVGGFVCMLGQILVIKTKMTSSRILVTFELLGVILEAFGLFAPIQEFAKAGITVPIIGFGASLARGAIAGAKAQGIFGALSGGVVATAGGIAAAVVFAYLFALIFNSKTKG